MTCQGRRRRRGPTLLIVMAKPSAWPKDTVEQGLAVADLLASDPVPFSLGEIANRFTSHGLWKKSLPQLLGMLVSLGHAEVREHGLFAVRC